MEEIELVIKIPDKTINDIKDNAMFAGSISSDIRWDVTSAIVNGTPLKKGHWIKHHNDNLGRCMRDNLECSVCGKWMCDSPYQSFCPSCGADMRGEQV